MLKRCSSEPHKMLSNITFKGTEAIRLIEWRPESCVSGAHFWLLKNLMNHVAIILCVIFGSTFTFRVWIHSGRPTSTRPKGSTQILRWKTDQMLSIYSRRNRRWFQLPRDLKHLKSQKICKEKQSKSTDFVMMVNEARHMRQAFSRSEFPNRNQHFAGLAELRFCHTILLHNSVADYSQKQSGYNPEKFSVATERRIKARKSCCWNRVKLWLKQWDLKNKNWTNCDDLLQPNYNRIEKFTTNRQRTRLSSRQKGKN